MTLDARFESAVASQIDVERARRAARAIALTVGFDRQEAEAVAIVGSELASNLVRHAHGGTIVIAAITAGSRNGIAVETRDRGPGIADVSLAIQDRFSTSGGLGCGLPAVGRLMDEFTIESSPAGSIIKAWKWTTLTPVSPSA